MNTTAPLSSSHLRTYNRIFQHPISHNLDWRDVHSLLSAMAEVTEEHNGNLKVTRNGEVLVLHASRTKEVAEMDEVMTLRHFLQDSEKAQPKEGDHPHHWLLVINHEGARIFQSEIKDGVPESILPHKPEDYFRHAQDSKETSRGQEKPDPNTFFEPVAMALPGSGPILIFGTGTGTSSEAEQFVTWCKTHHPAMVERIVGSLVVDEHHLSEGQLLAKAREFYATQPLLTSRRT